MAIEEEFALEIPDNEADKIASIGDAIKYITAHPQVRREGGGEREREGGRGGEGEGGREGAGDDARLLSIRIDPDISINRVQYTGKINDCYRCSLPVE